MKFGKSVGKFIQKYWWESILAILFIFGVYFGWSGFSDIDKYFLNNSYETLRLFFINARLEETKIVHLPMKLEIARWLAFLFFIMLSFKLFLTIIAPRFVQQAKIRRYKNHVIICGLDEIAMELINKLNDTKIIVIASKNIQYAESLKQRGVKMVIGNPADKAILKSVNVAEASQLYAITDNDIKNVEIAQSAFSLRQINFPDKPNQLQCFTHIQDRELKNILEETALFKYKGILFNINEIGIKYGICTNIDKILIQKMDDIPELLLIGLTDKAENVILQLTHCLTMNRKSFRFTIVESNKEIIGCFKLKYGYLSNFVEIRYIGNIQEVFENKTFTAIFVCLENQIESIKTAISVRNIIAANQPNIFAFSEESESLNDVFNAEGYKILPLRDRNIFMINTLEETIQYIIKLNPVIETLAEAAHNLWRKKDESGNYMEKDEYRTISGHFKQANRNQVLDNYLRTFIATGKKFDAPRDGSLVVFSDKDKETLAEMEHRRWMLEKYNNGWHYGKIRNDNFKVHTDFCTWEELSESNKQKDYNAINLMINQINQQIV